MLKKYKAIILIAAVALSFIAWLTLRLFTPGVIVAEARKDTAVQAITGTIEVLADIETRIVSTGNGFLMNSKLEEGGIYKKDELIAQIDPGSLPFEIESTSISIKDLERQIAQGHPEQYRLDTLKEDLEEAKELQKAGHLSKAELDATASQVRTLEARIENELDSLQSRLDSLQNTLAKQEDTLERLKIYAPMDCQVTALAAHPGDLLSTGHTIADIISIERKIAAEVNQDDIDIIKEGSAAKVRFFAYGDRMFEAEVKLTLPSSDPETQRFTVYLGLKNPPERLLPGLTGEVVFYAGEKENTIVIPRRALLGNNIFVVKSGEAELRRVKTGYLSYTEAEILEGVEVGEKVIVENLDLFRDGDRVRIDKTVER